MATKRIRAVVYLRCPLCGAWMPGDGQEMHWSTHHAQMPSPAPYKLPQALTGPAVPFDQEMAGRILDDLERLVLAGQAIALGFEIYESS